jgi:hypothetical protein
MLVVRAYPRETQELVFDAHDRAFVLFKGACGRGIYDNMKTAVEAIFVGKQRLYNRRFLQMCSPYLIEPVPACRRAARRVRSRTKSGSSSIRAGRQWSDWGERASAYCRWHLYAVHPCWCDNKYRTIG